MSTSARIQVGATSVGVQTERAGGDGRCQRCSETATIAVGSRCRSCVRASEAVACGDGHKGEAKRIHIATHKVR